MQDDVEELFIEMQQQIEKIKKTYNKIPTKIRKELKENYPDSCPYNSIDTLCRDIDYWYRNIDSVIEDLEEWWEVIENGIRNKATRWKLNT